MAVYPSVIIANAEEDIEFEKEGTEESQEIVLINGKEVNNHGIHNS